MVELRCDKTASCSFDQSMFCVTFEVELFATSAAVISGEWFPGSS